MYVRGSSYLSSDHSCGNLERSACVWFILLVDLNMCLPREQTICVVHPTHSSDHTYAKLERHLLGIKYTAML